MGVVYEPESDEDLQSVGLLVEEDEEDTEEGASTESADDEAKERTYTQQELTAHAEDLRRSLQSQKDREVAKVNRRVAALEDELKRERELSGTYKKFASKWWEMDGSSKEMVEDLEEKHLKRGQELLTEAVKADDEEKAIEFFNTKWVSTMEELAEDVIELGLTSVQFNDAVAKYSSELLSTNDWDSFRRKARKEIRASATIKQTEIVKETKETSVEAPKKKLVPVKASGNAAKPTDWASMSDADMLRAEQELIDSQRK